MANASITVADVLSARRGHFVFESGHHGDLWLDLELLCWRPRMVRPLAGELAERLAAHKVDVVCGPLVEGAFVGLMVAEALDVAFCYTQQIERDDRKGLFPVDYLVPAVLRGPLRGKRVAIVNDVINAGSAVCATAADLTACGAELAALATLATIGTSAAEIAQQYAVPLISLATIAGEIWKPDHCPLCRDGVPLTR